MAIFSRLVYECIISRAKLKGFKMGGDGPKGSNLLGLTRKEAGV